MPSARKIRIEQKLVGSARAHLGDEEVLRVFLGQTSVSPILIPLVGSLLPAAKPRAVVVTPRSVVTLQRSAWSESTVVGLVSRHECGATPIQVSRWGLKIGDDPKIFATLSTLADMQEVARLAGRPTI